MPQNSVMTMARTRDGYLWFGTVEGLVRFDGVRFTIFDRTNTPEIGNSHITALWEDRAGALWIGTAGGGLTQLRGGKFTRFTTRDGLAENYVTALCEDRDGAIWVGTFSRGLSRWQNGRWTAVGTGEGGLPNAHVQALAADRHGHLWVGMDRFLVELTPGDGGVAAAKLTAFPLPGDTESRAVVSLCVDRAGVLWVGTTEGLQKFEQGAFVPRGEGKEAFRTVPVMALTEDRAGWVWVGTDRGSVFRGKQGDFAECPTQGPMPEQPVRAFCQDPSGALWVGTDGGGLVRLRHGRIGAYTTRDGLSGDLVRPILQDPAGTIWVGTATGLNRFENGGFVPVVAAAPAWPEPKPLGRTNALTLDPQGQLVLASPGEGAGAFCLAEKRLVPLTSQVTPPVISLLSDRAGNVWVGSTRGVTAYAAADAAPLPLPKEGFTDAHIESLFEDRAGNIWVGTVDAGLGRYRDGKFTRWTMADGLGDNHVLGFHEDRAGSLWIGTHGGGLIRFRDGQFVTITSRDGLYDDLAFSIIEDDTGELWMSGNKGIYRASLRELNAFADGEIKRVRSYGYGAADGMISRECNGTSPAGWKMRDGTLWFPTIKGVAVVNPAQRNPEPPRMVIERVVVDRVRHSLVGGEGSVTLQPGQEELEIEYTGLSWQRPQQIRFEFRLAGLDRDWTNAGTRRAAYFSHLPAGTYNFEVRADNGDGVWSLAPAMLRVVVLPPFWQTWWFLLLAGALVAAAVTGGFWWRGRQLRQRYAMRRDFSRRLIAAHETERRRVAAELHDGLGQTLAMLKNSALFATQNAHDLPTARRQIEQITEHSAQAISEVREIAYNLRPYLLDRLGLTKALRSMLHKVAPNGSPALDVDIDNLDGVFGAEAEMSVYRIVQESVNNVLKHADATRATVCVEVREEAVHLLIEDDGRGFVVGATRNGDRPGFGLIGIAERVRLLDGTQVIESAPGQGTRISIRLPYERRILRPES